MSTNNRDRSRTFNTTDPAEHARLQLAWNNFEHMLAHGGVASNVDFDDLDYVIADLVAVRHRGLAEIAAGDTIRTTVTEREDQQLLVIDPCYLSDWDHEQSYDAASNVTLSGPGGQLSEAPGSVALGVAFSSGFGDGEYDVWATVRDYPGWGKRVVRVEIDLIGDDEPE